MHLASRRCDLNWATSSPVHCLLCVYPSPEHLAAFTGLQLDVDQVRNDNEQRTGEEDLQPPVQVQLPLGA